MATTLPFTPAFDELARALRAVRARWRLRVALRGLAVAAALSLLAVGLAAAGMERLGWSPEGVRALRWIAWGVIALILGWWVARPLARRVPDERVALYLEEREPSLDASVISAVEAARDPAMPLRAPLASHAVARVRAVDGGRRIERRELARSGAMLAAALLAWALLLGLGPDWMRRGAALTFAPWRAAEAAEAYAIAVTPGSATVARGADQRIGARLRGFGSDEVVLAVRRGADSTWERIPMTLGADSAEFAARLFDVAARTEYYVEAQGIRSPTYALDVADLPAVERIDLEYRFPAYTGLAPRTVEDGGDIAAVRGTVVRVRVTPTMPVRAGRIVIEGRDTVALAADSGGALAGEVVVRRPGFYAVALQGATGPMTDASLDYAIDVLDDEAPTVSFRKPGRDLKVTSLEEVFVEAVAEDDYGVRRLELVWSVNGGAPKSLALHQGARAAREVSGAHTFYLEELGLRPGDIVSYFARATDGDGVSGAKTATSDIYFMEVRPFGREYRQAEQGGGMPGSGQPDAAWSQRQREIVAGTFNARRDRAAGSDAEFRENVATLALAQGRLRGQVERVAQQLRARGIVTMDSTFRIVAEELPKAIAEMQAAEQALGKRDADGALPPEQRALQHLLRAEAAFRERQVAQGDGGGGGGGGSQDADELADLFELETDKLRNQYETVQRGRERQADEEVDETLERLRRLAARQQRENERAREMAGRMARQGGSGGGSGGEAQRQLAAEAEEMARRLERLARERSSEEMRDAARRLRESAATMRRQAAAGERGSAEGSRALEGIEEARRMLERSRGGRLERDARDAARRAEALAERQRESAADVERAMGEGAGSERERRAFERKDQMTAEVEALERDLDRMARESRREQPEASRRLQRAADAIRDGRLADRLRYSKEVMRGGSPEYARNFEEQITGATEELRRRVAEAAGAVREPDGRRTAQALDRARDLVRGLESMRERMEERGQGPGTGDRGEQRGQAQGQGQGQGQGQQARGEGQGQGQGQGEARGGKAGEPGQLPRGEYGRASGDARPGMARGAARPFTPDELRALRRELGERRADAEALRRALMSEGVESGDLEGLIARLRELERGGAFDDPEELRRLQGAVVEGFKAFEFALRRSLEGDAREPLLGASDEVPPEYRRLVEEYYKSLSRRGQRE